MASGEDGEGRETKSSPVPGPGPGQNGEAEVKTSDEVTRDVTRGFTCTNCTAGMPASHYCPQCDVFYCRTCLMDMCEHGALGRANVAEWGKTVPLLDDTCRRHPGERVQIYCPLDDVVACCTCSQDDHMPCHLKYIPDVDKEMNQTSNIPKVKRDLKRISKTIKGMKSTQEQRQAILKKSHYKANSIIRTFRKRLNSILDKLEKQSEEEIKKFQQSENNKLQANLNKLNELEKEVNLFQEKLETIGKNTSQIFTRVKSCQTWINNADKTLLDMNASAVGVKIDYNLNYNITQTLGDLESFGTIVKPETVYTARKMKEYTTLKISQDLFPCNITSICQVADERFVVADNDNNRLKLLDKYFNVIHHLDLVTWPWSVCTLSPTEIAVTLGGKQVQIIAVSNILVPGPRYPLSHACMGIGRSSNRVYITDQYNSLFVYLVLRKQFKIDSMVQIKAGFLEKPRNIAVNASINTLFIADLDKGVATINEMAQVLGTFKPREINSAFGICVAPNGYVFVAGRETDNIVQLDKKGERVLKEVVPQSKGLSKPQSLCIDRTSYRLIVVGCSNNLRVYDLVQETS